MIRLAVRCTPEQAEIVLAELTVLAPNGVEEERGPGYVEYAIYGGEGELPELGEIEVAAGDGLVEVVSTEVPDDWADRWQDFHKPLLVGERLWLRPSWEEPREGTIDLVVDPGRAFGTGAHPTTRLCLELCWSWRRPARRGAAHRSWDRLRRAGDRGRQARLGAGPRLRPRGAGDRGGDDQRRGERRFAGPGTAQPARGLARAGTNGCGQHDCAGPEGGRGAVSDGGSRERVSRSNSGEAPGDPLPAPATLILSGLLHSELDGTAAAFAPVGLGEADRRLQGDWAALLLRR